MSRRGQTVQEALMAYAKGGSVKAPLPRNMGELELKR